MTARWCADVRGQTDDGALIPSLLIQAEHVHSFSEDILITYRKDKGGKLLLTNRRLKRPHIKYFPQYKNLLSDLQHSQQTLTLHQPRSRKLADSPVSLRKDCPRRVLQ